MPQPQQAPPSPAVLLSFVALEACALLGATVTGVLARKRRQQLESTNEKLRRINAELRRQREIDCLDGLSGTESDGVTYRTALERSLDAPSAAHPTEQYSFGALKLSLARARRQLEDTVREAKLQLRTQDAASAAQVLPVLADAEQTAKDIKDQRAQRAISRLRARALRATGDLPGALTALQEVLQLSTAIEGGPDDADTLGEMGDVLAEMGDFEAAGKLYDRCIVAIETGAPTSQLSSTWDAS